MQLVPRIYPILARVNLLKDLLSRDIVAPEADLVSFRLKFFELGRLLVQFKDTPSAKRVASSVQQVFALILQT
jgi:hypothetical protein